MDLRERSFSRSASIPSKRRGPIVIANTIAESLTVRKISGFSSSMNGRRGSANAMTSSNGITSSNQATLDKINSTRLSADIKRCIRSDVEYDQRSLELLVRLLKAGPFVHDVMNDENIKPNPLTPTPSLENIAADDDETIPNGCVTDYVINQPNNGAKILKAVSVSKLKKEQEDALERFGVCMSVNGKIARVRNAQKKNEDSRRKAGKLPNLTTDSSNESLESEKPASTPRKDYVMKRSDTWLSLSGRKIDLRHQGHVEKVLTHAERDVTKPEGKPKRNIRSAPPNAGTVIAPPGSRKFAWSGGRRYGNRFIMNKLNKSFRGKSSISFAASFHGFEYAADSNENVVNDTSEVTTKSSQEPSIEKSFNPSGNRGNDWKSRPSRDTITRPSSAVMPRAIRSIVIKLPNSITDTSQNITSSFGNATSQSTYNTVQSNFPTRQSGRLENFKRAIS